MVLLVLGVVLLVVGVVLLLVQLPFFAIVAFVIGLVLILVRLFRGRRSSAGDSAVVSAINSGGQ